MDERTEALLQDAAFEDDVVDADALEQLLAGSPEARERLVRLQDLAGALNEMGAGTPVPHVVGAVMTAVGGTRRGHGISAGVQGGLMTKKWIVGIAATVAAALGIYVAMGGSVPPQGTEGTIGAAKRYQGQQLTSDDVQLGDQSTQDFLQSATFDALRRDPELRKSFVSVVSNPGFAKLATDAELVRRLTTDAEIVRRLSTDAELFRKLTTDADFIRRLSTDAELVRKLSTDADFVRRLTTDADFVRKLTTDAELLRRLSTDADFVRKLTSDAEFLRKLTSDAELLRKLSSADAELFARLASDAGLRQLVLGPDFANLAIHSKFLAQLGPHAQFYAKLTSDSGFFARLANDAEFAKLAGDAALGGRITQ